MASVEQNASPRATRAGALRALHLGAQSVSEMAELVNWGNRSDYQRKAINPWVALEDSLASSAPTIADAQFTVETEVAAVQDAAVLEEVESAPVLSAEQDVLEEERKLTEAHEQSAVDEVNDGAGIEQPEAGHDASDTTEQAKVEDEVAEVAADAVPADEQVHETVKAEANATSDSQVASSNSTDAGQTTADASQVVQVQPEPQASTATPQVNPPQRTQPTPNAQPSKPRAIAASSMTSTASKPIKAMPTKSLAPAGQHDEYLQRLETLVLELNWQLAQQAGDAPQPSESDYVQWLSRRVVELSVENLSLQEKLRQLQGE